MKRSDIIIILTGTDPSSMSGGIGFALKGYLAALNAVDVNWCIIPTYHPTAYAGKYLPWIMSFPKVWLAIYKYQKQKKKVIVYSHAGRGKSFFREFFLLTFSRILGVKTIMQLHGPQIDGYLSHFAKKWLFKIAIKPAETLGVLTPWWEKRLMNKGIKKPLIVISNPLSLRLQLVASLPISKKKFKDEIVLLSLARLVEGKGVDIVIEAMTILPEKYRLVIAGDGILRKKLEARTIELGLLNRIKFIGWVSGEEKQRLFESVDVFVLPSTNDSFGMVFVEAMSNGLPVIAADWGAIPDVVPNRKCGILINQLEPKDVASAVIELKDSEIRRRMGVEGKRWVLEKFSADSVGKDILKMIDKVLVNR